MEYEKLIEPVVALAEKAGRAILEVYSTDFEVQSKADESPLTQADLASHRCIAAGLAALTPDIPIVSEEDGIPPFATRRRWSRYWLIDPLDGTKEFVKGWPEYSVAVALVETGEPLLGVVHNPATGDTFSAARGLGAFRNRRAIRVREGARLLASRSEVRRGEFEPFSEAWDVQPVGSIQYKLALVAAGEAAVTFSRGPKHEWDVCAGALIVAEAGGLATDLFGDPLRYNQPFPKVKGILAGASGAYARAQKEIAAIGASDRMDELTEGS